MRHDALAQHNTALAEFLVSGEKNPQVLLAELRKCRAALESAASATQQFVPVNSVAVMAYNEAALLYMTRNYAAARDILVPLLGNAGVLHETVMASVCTLLLELCLRVGDLVSARVALQALAATLGGACLRRLRARLLMWRGVQRVLAWPATRRVRLPSLCHSRPGHPQGLPRLSRIRRWIDERCARCVLCCVPCCDAHTVLTVRIQMRLMLHVLRARAIMAGSSFLSAKPDIKAAMDLDPVVRRRRRRRRGEHCADVGCVCVCRTCA